MSKDNKIAEALEALEALDLRELKSLRPSLDAEIERRAMQTASGDPDYARAVRECLIDCEAFLQSARKGLLRHEHMGQLDVLLRDVTNLRNRENVPTYGYKKST